MQVEYSDMSVMSWNLTGLDLICGMKNHTNSTHVIHGVQVSEIVFYALVLKISKRAIFFSCMVLFEACAICILHSAAFNWIIFNGPVLFSSSSAIFYVRCML